MLCRARFVAIAALADRQHGVVAGRRLRVLGVSQRAISHRVAAGRLHRVRTGVYGVGRPRLEARGRWMAAVHACGPGAALNHASAAALRGLRLSASASIDVTVPRTGKRSRGGIRIHRPRTLRPDETTTNDGIPVTTPRTTASPEPAVNTTLEGKEVDFLFRAHRRSVETDCWRPPRLRGGPRQRRPHDQSRLPHAAVHRSPADRGPPGVAAAIHTLLADRRAA